MNAPFDRDLLFGIIAFEKDFISRDTLVAATNEWLADQSKPISQILLAKKVLDQEQAVLLTTLVQKRLKIIGHEPTQDAGSDRTLQLTGRDPEQPAGLADQPTLALPSAESTPVDDPASNQQTLPLSAVLSAAISQGSGAAPFTGIHTNKVSSGTGTRFRRLRPWREGGLGTVSIARDEELHRDVALKEIKPQHASNKISQNRFLLEGEVTGSLEHPGIVPVYGMGRYNDGRPYYAMRFVHGESLEEAIDKFHKTDALEGYQTGKRAVAFRELISRFIAVCNAIAYAHSRGVLHRDLKPGNILLAKYGETLVVDWGLAKVAGQVDTAAVPTDEAPLELQSGTSTTATRFGSIIGTPTYMSPEQSEGRLDLLGPATDIYSLGATLYCLLVGHGPFRETNLDALLSKVRRGEFPAPRQANPNVPRPLEAICLKAMATKREDRYSSATELADDLEHWLADEPVSAYPEGRREKAARWIRRHRTAAAAIAIGLLLLTVVSAVAAILINHQRQIADRLAEDNRRLAVEEHAARDQSDINFHEARQAVDDLFTSVSEDSLLNQPGMQKLRNELLQKTLAYYQRFLTERADDPTVREEFAATQFRVGRILDELQSPESALPYLTKAQELQQQLLREMPGDARRLQGLGETENALGRCLHRGQHLDEALKSYEAGRDARQRLVDLAPADPEYQRALANSVMNIGLVEKDRGELDAAADRFQAARQIRQSQIAAGNDSAKLKRDLAMGAYNEGLLALDRERTAEAVQRLNDAIDGFQHLDQHDLSVQKQLATCYRVAADAHSKDASPDESIRLYELARDAFARLVDRNPDVDEYQATLAGIYMNMASQQERASALDAAIASCENARSNLDALVNQFPKNARFRGDLAVSLRSLAILQDKAGQHEVAHQNLRSSIDRLEKLLDEFPNDQRFKSELETSRRVWNDVFSKPAEVNAA